MGRIVVFNSLTLDGVMQAPGGPDEDRRGGFTKGGWALPYQDRIIAETAAEGMATADALRLGRRTYQQFRSHWPHQRNNPYAEVLESARKSVASRTLTEPLPWRNSVLLGGDATAAVARLREEPGGDIVVLGSGVLLQSLIRHGLVDTYTLLM